MLTDQRAYDRFSANVCPEPNSGCHLWMGSYSKSGYGAFSYGRQIGAHVFSYIAHHGDIPPGRVVHHRCNVPACVNPQHLEAVTASENMKIARDQKRALGHVLVGKQRPSQVTSFCDLIACWPTQQQFSDEVEIGFWTVVGWQRRDSIPAQYWPAIIDASRKRGWSDITVDLLANIKAKKRRTRRPASPAS